MKLCSHISLVEQQLFADEVSKTEPDQCVCPRLIEKIHEICDMHYGSSKLKVGWFVTGCKEDGQPIDWTAWELDDCTEYLRSLKRNIIDELNTKYENSVFQLNHLLSNCFDFALLFSGLCRIRKGEKNPVNTQSFFKLGADDFRRYVSYASQLPHVREQDLELEHELSLVIFWRFKKVLIEIVWGSMFATHFGVFFPKKNGEFSLEDLTSLNKLQLTSFKGCHPPQFCWKFLKALEAIAKICINGTKDRGASKHRVPVYRDRRSLKHHEEEFSKVLQLISISKARLPFPL